MKARCNKDEDRVISGRNVQMLSEDGLGIAKIRMSCIDHYIHVKYNA